MTQAQRPLALVTGASSGIGRQLAAVAATNGYDVLAVARRADRLRALAEEVAAHGVTVTPLVVDLSQPGAATEVVAGLPDRAVDVLVNDAGWAAGAGSLSSGT